MTPKLSYSRCDPQAFLNTYDAYCQKQPKKQTLKEPYVKVSNNQHQPPRRDIQRKVLAAIRGRAVCDCSALFAVLFITFFV